MQGIPFMILRRSHFLQSIVESREQSSKTVVSKTTALDAVLFFESLANVIWSCERKRVGSGRIPREGRVVGNVGLLNARAGKVFANASALCMMSQLTTANMWLDKMNG